jgi:hypothetical protein
MKVACIYHFKRERANWPGFKFPKFGHVYTVIDTVRENDSKWYVIAELENIVCWHGGWWAKRFRPVVDAMKSELLEEIA